MKANEIEKMITSGNAFNGIIRVPTVYANVLFDHFLGNSKMTILSKGDGFTYKGIKCLAI